MPKYKPDMTPFFRRAVAKDGSMSFHSVFIKDELFDKLQSIEKGGLLEIKVKDPDSVSEDNKFLSGYLNYKSPAELAEEKAAWQARKGSKGSSGDSDGL